MYHRKVQLWKLDICQFQMGIGVPASFNLSTSMERNTYIIHTPAAVEIDTRSIVIEAEKMDLFVFHTPKAINRGSLIAHPYFNLSPYRGRLKNEQAVDLPLFLLLTNLMIGSKSNSLPVSIVKQRVSKDSLQRGY